MMKNFYEDNFENNDAEDISSGRFDFEDVTSFAEKEDEQEKSKIQKPPHLPGVKPSVKFRSQKANPQGAVSEEPQVPQWGPYPPMYYPPMPMQGGEQPNVNEQGYPVYPPQPYYGQYPVPPYMPYDPNQPPYGAPQHGLPYYMSANGQPPQVKNDNNNNKNNPGTRVLYQSVDFERKESDSDNFAPTYTGITHEDVIFEEEVVSAPESKKKKTQPQIKKPPSSFTEDEMEIGTFELNAIALGQKTRAKVLKHVAEGRYPGTTDVSTDEYEQYFENPYGAADGEPSQKKKGKKVSKGEAVRRIVLSVSIIAFVIAGAMLLNEYRLSKQNDDVMQNVEQMIIDVPETEEPTTEKKSDKKNNKNNKKPTKKPAADKKDETQTTALSEQQQWDKLKSEYPNVVFPANLQLKYAKLYAENQDFVGYLSAEGVNLSLPIVQAQDDEEYMQKNFYGAKTKYGCPFVTHVNNISPLDTNTVIFGHHMNNGTVFGTLDAYKSIDGFRKAPVITFNTLSEDYQWKIIAAFITNAYEEDDNGYVFKYYFTTLSTPERYASYLSELSQRSLYDTGVDVLPTDKILTLSTCSHEFENARFVVVARLVRKGESPTVDVSRASVNENPRYPQAYYDKKNKTNPYSDAYRWEVG